ncbi:YheV family putative zinc ribbon protein [Pectobacterium sp. B2J-2]|uniref:YheV family putative zinc ribbon protein n=1 Tax=Pectobacterium sp. B2J-2 TaxID=3385372 RepID=UPI0038FC269D
MRKRFIAGAVCPMCQAQDTLAVGREDDVEVVVCVKCGYRQSQADEPAVAAAPQANEIIGIFRPE